MQSFINERLPDDIALNARGGVSYSTDIIETYSGHEQRNINWSQARGSWLIDYNNKTADEMSNLIDFFNSVRGKAIGFRFKDWTDYKAEQQPLKHISGDGYQLVKNYSNGSLNYERKITKPVLGTVKIYEDGVLQNSSSYSIDYNTGIITTSLSGILTADFEFDVPVRFDIDKIEVVAVTDKIFSWNSISLLEVRL